MYLRSPGIQYYAHAEGPRSKYYQKRRGRVGSSVHVPHSKLPHPLTNELAPFLPVPRCACLKVPVPGVLLPSLGAHIGIIMGKPWVF